VVLGDESGYEANANQKMKLAAIEGMWHTQKAPASLTLLGIPNAKTQENQYAIEIPYVLGLIATRSIHEPVQGIAELVEEGKGFIKDGMIAYDALSTLQKNPNDTQAREVFEKHQKHLGYALLLKKYTPSISQASEEQINLAAHDLEPKVLPLFLSFRIMVACGLFFIGLFAYGFYLMIRRQAHQNKWFLKIAFWALPLPWVAAELGWVIAEYGRQPWVVQGILPTFMGTSSINLAQILTSLIGFVLFYSILAVVEVYLMVKYIRLGPDGMKL
jgi:cytochrome d ubiquinol oxidase subunit I